MGAFFFIFILCFLLGSVPWGLVISTFVFKKDLRTEGSGNIGTTNAIRSMGFLPGAVVFLLDFGKGLLSGFIGSYIAARTGSDTAVCVALAFLACVWGHIFSPWLSFKGGKGIAVAIGCLFITFGPVGALIELAIFAILVPTTRYVSVGSIAAALACPLLALFYFWGNIPAWLLCSVSALTVVWAHRANIARLRAGSENRIGKHSGVTNG